MRMQFPSVGSSINAGLRAAADWLEALCGIDRSDSCLIYARHSPKIAQPSVELTFSEWIVSLRGLAFVDSE